MTRWPPVLMYHAVERVADDPNNICVSPERFEAQMLYLRRRKLRGVSMRELQNAMITGNTRGIVGLTFDDGYDNVLRAALPVLERCGFSATVFVVADALGRENSWDLGPRMKLLGVEGIREVAERGMEVASHGMSHIGLSGMKPELLEREVNDSRFVLGEILGEPVQGFCYPYGSLDGKVADAVRRAGYDYACAYNKHVSWDAYDVPRMYVGERDNVLRLAAKLKIHPWCARIASTLR